MTRLERRYTEDHEVLEIQTHQSYRPYDRLILRDAKGRTVWTVPDCEASAEGWLVTAIRGDTFVFT